MKPIHLLAAFTFSMSSLVFAAGGHDHGHEHKPLHGGVVSEVKDMDYELVAKPDVIQLYLRDHGKPADISKGSAKLTVLSGNKKQEINLLPDGERFLAKGTDGGVLSIVMTTQSGYSSTTHCLPVAES